jgi:hypothetical protein
VFLAIPVQQDNLHCLVSLVLQGLGIRRNLDNLQSPGNLEVLLTLVLQDILVSLLFQEFLEFLEIPENLAILETQDILLSLGNPR